jgi:hypothetical protein
MINILSGYKNFPEETAARMLSNDILIEQLRKAETNEAFQNYVEAAVVAENEQLIGENVLLTKKYEVEQSAKVDATNKLNVAEDLIQHRDKEVKEERQQRLKAEEDAQAERNKRLQTEQRYKLLISIALSILTTAILIGAFELIIYTIPCTWLINHPNSYSLQVSIDILFGLLAFIVFVPKWRKYVAIALLLPVLGILIPLIGGPGNR